jgi:hypothetical protein
MAPEHKPTKHVFVIMPFSSTPTRNQTDLSIFFETNLKKRIEGEDGFRYRYSVHRSQDTFDITPRIIQDLYSADIVICDLSGREANPNVMYELGVRLAVSSNPVILVREKHEANQRIFDISGFHIFEYSPYRYREAEEYIIRKMRAFETEQEVFRSPVLDVLKLAPSVVLRMHREFAYRIFASLHAQLFGIARIFTYHVQKYLHERTDLSFPEETQEMWKFIWKHTKELHEVDWSGFSFRAYPLPSLNEFLTKSPLLNLVPLWLEVGVNSYALEYYFAYFASADAFTAPFPRRVLEFLGESRFFMGLAAEIASHIKEHEDGTVPTEEIKKVTAILLTTALLHPEYKDKFKLDSEEFFRTGSPGVVG